MPPLTGCSPLALALAGEEVANVPTKMAYDPVSPSAVVARAAECTCYRRGLDRDPSLHPSNEPGPQLPLQDRCFLVL